MTFFCPKEEESTPPFLFTGLFKEVMIDTAWARAGCGTGAGGCISQPEFQGLAAPSPTLPEPAETKGSKPPFLPKRGGGGSPPRPGAKILKHHTVPFCVSVFGRIVSMA